MLFKNVDKDDYFCTSEASLELESWYRPPR